MWARAFKFRIEQGKTKFNISKGQKWAPKWKTGARVRVWTFRQKKQSKMRGKGEYILEMSIDIYGLMPEMAHEWTGLAESYWFGTDINSLLPRFWERNGSAWGTVFAQTILHYSQGNRSISAIWIHFFSLTDGSFASHTG